MSTDTVYTSIDRSLMAEYNRTRPLGPKPLFCYVPFNNIFFSFSGKVIACPYNQQVVLGTYPEKTIKEIWYSEAGKKLRAHLEHNDLSNGCKHCQHYLEKKKFSGLKPLVFDQYSNYKDNQMPKVLEFSLENTCNLECIMCSGEVSSSIRKNRDKLPPIHGPYDEAFVSQLAEFIPHAEEAKFYGGEPFMMPIYFSIWDKIYELNKDMKLFTITNGTKLNTRIKEVLERQKFEIAVSIDGYTRETYSKIRKNADYDSVMKNLEYFNKYCLANGYRMTISFTAMRENWQELPLMIKLCNDMKAHIYISYVHKPYQQALWNLPAEQLKEMITFLKDQPVALDSYIISYKKYNKEAYADFVTYLEGCYAKNAAERDQQNAQYISSGYAQTNVQDQAQAGNKEPMRRLTRMADAPEVFSERLLKANISEEKRHLFGNKLSALRSSVIIDDVTLYTLLCSTPVEIIVADVCDFPEDKLAAIIQTKAAEVVE